ncbi:MAG: hypothetical protein WCW14_04195 [Candidatus Paceibacterota bacterium]|jgi:hypothetical protein
MGIINQPIESIGYLKSLEIEEQKGGPTGSGVRGHRTARNRDIPEFMAPKFDHLAE